MICCGLWPQLNKLSIFEKELLLPTAVDPATGYVHQYLAGPLGGWFTGPATDPLWPVAAHDLLWPMTTT